MKKINKKYKTIIFNTLNISRPTKKHIYKRPIQKKGVIFRKIIKKEA